MKKTFLVLAGFLCLTFLPISSYGFSIVGGANYNFNKTSGQMLTIPTEMKGGMGFLGGFLWNFGKIELGLLYMSTTTKATVAGIEVNSSTSSLHIPLVYRLGGGKLSLGVGGFYDAAISSGSSSDYGVTVGPRLHFAGNAFLDARFEYGLKSMRLAYDTPQTMHTTTALLMLGYRFR